MAINPVGSPVAAVPSISMPGSSQRAEGSGFADTLKQLVDKVETSGAAANDAVGRMLDGTGEVHEAMIALQSSDLNFQLAVQVRNKFVQAYQDIMRMPV
jgi:flagellar hook-basal body complex protein FliE